MVLFPSKHSLLFQAVNVTMVPAQCKQGHNGVMLVLVFPEVALWAATRELQFTQYSFDADTNLHSLF